MNTTKPTNDPAGDGDPELSALRQLLAAVDSLLAEYNAEYNTCLVSKNAYTKDPSLIHSGATPKAGA